MEYRLIPMEERHLLTLAALERICFPIPERKCLSGRAG